MIMRGTCRSKASSPTFQLSVLFAQVRELVFTSDECVTLFTGCSAHHVGSLKFLCRPCAKEGLSETPSHSPEITVIWGTVGERIAAVKFGGQRGPSVGVTVCREAGGGPWLLLRYHFCDVSVTGVTTAPVPPAYLRGLIHPQVLLKVINAVWSVWHCSTTQANNICSFSQAPQHTNSDILHPFLKGDLVSDNLEPAGHHPSAYSWTYWSPTLLAKKTCISAFQRHQIYR